MASRWAPGWLGGGDVKLIAAGAVLRYAGETQTPLQRRIQQLAVWITWGILVIAAIAFALILYGEARPTQLFTAIAILGLIAWYVLRLGRPEAALMQARRAREPRLFGLTTGLMHLTFVQILIGALVAGIDAGRNYVDWPLMAGGFFPPDPFQLEPWWRNFFEDDGLVQFVHRITAYLLVVFAAVVWRASRRSANAASRRAHDWVAAAVAVQLVLGIVTVMHSAVWYLAILHQLTAVALWVLVIRARFLAQYPLPQSLRGRVAA